MATNKVATAVEELIAPGLDDMGIELVDIQYIKEAGHWFVRIFIDQPSGIGLEDCQRVSQYVDPLLDEHDLVPHAYTLEVSSPGIERPLKKLADYERFAGRQISLNTFVPVEGRRKFKGVLMEASNQSVTLEAEGNNIVIPMEQVASARLIAEF
ncbi:MAG TPA: ribosome maturation factor RimP [Desulfotomaculum sp.]|nr:MAG: ribosome maturation factor RimP [Peptococcaceae bacterium BRH_c8a]KJS78935.1 MAG: ribosome maturation factor RimP [Desulfotomaculum sp. BICA1-6]HBX23773.1 ribosome maturation factor RimP [Desulfotomaculum sp.]